jgi:hypothetical protein
MTSTRPDCRSLLSVHSQLQSADLDGVTRPHAPAELNRRRLRNQPAVGYCGSLRLRRVLAGSFATLIGASLWTGCTSRASSFNAMPPGAAASRTALHADVSRDAVRRGATVTVTTLNDAGAGSLRAAITSVNARHSAHAIISFSINGTITLASDLPVPSTTRACFRIRAVPSS